ncbi:hypothetical protein WHR41_08355 [Cladosporium halotolerans]|uniref:Uncharacterized protein n=1 Tax=Cladosporium halotolerans TaxID=1052096 RepID=A0AB34KCB2_9PEZI
MIAAFDDQQWHRRSPRPNMVSGQRKRKRMRRWDLLVVTGEAVKQVKPPRAAGMLQRARNVPPTRRSAHLHPPRLRSSLGVGEPGDAVSSRRHATHDRRHDTCPSTPEEKIFPAPGTRIAASG